MIKSRKQKKFFSLSMPKFNFSFKGKGKLGLILGGIVGVFVVILLIIGVIGYFSIYLPAMNIKAKGEELMAIGFEARENFKQNNIELVQNDINRLSEKYTEFEQASEAIYWLTFVPQVEDFKNVVEAGRYMISAGKQSVEAIYPYADLIGFAEGDTNFVEKSAEERLQTAVLTLDKILEDVDEIAENIDQAEQRIESIDPNQYPEKIGDTVVRERIIGLKDQFQGAASFFVEAKPLIKQLPKILGKDERRTYLVIFQNEHERRATGGFLTAYASFSIEDGKIELADSTNIYDLDNSISKRPPLPDKIATYHKNVNDFFIRDSNLSPDFVESIALFEELYNESSLKFEYDGIVSFDSHVLVDMLEVFGDTQAQGETFSAQIDERCDCPQAIYQIFDMVGRPVGFIREDRKGVLGDLMYGLFFKVVGFSPSQYWGPFAEKMFENMDEKHVLLYFKDPEIQAAVEQVNYGGRIAQYDNDYLHISNVNFAGAKSNLFVEEEIESETIFEGNSVKRNVRIVFKNPYPHSDCSLERSTLCLNATLRNWIRFYVPQGSKLDEFAGSTMDVQTYDELGKTVFEGFMTVSPEGRSEVNISYTLPSSITPENYSLMLQKQPSVTKQELEVVIDGRKKFDDMFKTDIEISEI